MQDRQNLLESFGDEYPFSPKTIDVDGFTQSYLDEGPEDAPVVVMVHGNPTWSFYYRKLVLGLRDRYRVIVPDHMGCGLSDKPQDYDYRLETHTNNLTKLLDSLQVDSCSMVVHDWGGAIGSGYAVSRPDSIRSMTIFNTGAFLSKRIPPTISLCRIPFFGELLVRQFNGFARGAIDLRMATAKPERFTKEVRNGYLGPYDSWENRIAIYHFVKDIPLSKKHPSYDYLKSIDDRLNLLADKPALVIWGMGDFCFDHYFLDEWIARLDRIQVHRFKDAGHYVVEDAHERIVPLMNDFLLNHA